MRLESLGSAPCEFGTVYADPPWPYRGVVAIGNHGRKDKLSPVTGEVLRTLAAKEWYPLMTVDEISSLPVEALVQSNSHLYLWTTNAFMREAHQVAEAWGFTVKTLITWVKLRKDGYPSMKTGYYYRGATEHMVFGVRGSLKLRGPCRPTVILTPRLGHSIKPEEAYALIEEQSPGPYLELFARDCREGWFSWGDEI